jgi:hypothetical protein
MRRALFWLTTAAFGVIGLSADAVTVSKNVDIIVTHGGTGGGATPITSFTVRNNGSSVSDEPWPPSERLDGSVLFAAADDQCAAAQPQGVRSASRLLGQLLTSLVSTSVR